MLKETGKYIRDNLAFIIAAMSFGLWGAANVMMRPASHTLGRIFDITGLESGDAIIFSNMYVMFLFSIIPAGLAVRKYGFKAMVVVGLILFAAGTLTFIPAAEICQFKPFILGYMLMSIGMLTLQISANPLVLTFGPRNESLFRIMIGQTFHAVGWLAGFYLVSDPLSQGPSGQEIAGISMLDSIAGSIAQRDALWNITTPYLIVGSVAVTLAIALGATSFFDRPQDENPRDSGIRAIVTKLWNDKVFVFGTLSQAAYIMAQTLCWSGIISYGASSLMGQGSDLTRSEASASAMVFVNIGIIAYGVIRLISAGAAAFGKYRPSKVLLVSSMAAAALCAVSIFAGEYPGVMCMVGVSACMSIMYPTIYYLSMRRQNISGIQVGSALHIVCVFGGLAAREVMQATGSEVVHITIAMVLFFGIAEYAWWCRKNKVGL